MQKKRADGHKRCRVCRDKPKAVEAEQATISVKQTRTPPLPRPYEECKRTERNNRRKRGREALKAICVPIEALKKRKLDVAPVDLVHLSKSIRRSVKTLVSIRTPIKHVRMATVGR